ncbi:unnamed protein product [Bursaphelenchus xylophilus]|uniref:Glycosyltransferase family 92 protein n=1 Tax=Bursaphelenchus xylophilus TaxID=6326 RepID=A0A1I7S589_BURXY|nr:unnamed protein product [Bursaphelenchus xylophilus]CAG9117821.1 unnamed protein product [Bursaphelenchus xylophilus]
MISIRSGFFRPRAVKRTIAAVIAVTFSLCMLISQRQQNLEINRMIYNLKQLSVFDSKWDPAQHIFVSSAFDIGGIESDNTTNTIRLLATTHDRGNDIVSRPPPIFCRNEFGDIVVGEWQFMNGPRPCIWKDYFLDCHFKRPSERLELVGDGAEILKVPITPAVKKKVPLVFCVARMFYYENWQIALTSLELYLHHGMDLFVIPIISVIEQLHIILKHYETLGYVRLKKGIVLPRVPEFLYDPNAKTDSLNMMPSQTECLYEYREAADFIIFGDIDDVIIPRRFENLLQEVQFYHQKFPNAPSFEFMWATTQLKLHKNPQHYNVRDIVSNLHVTTIADYGKSIVIPKRLRQGLIHFPIFDHDYAGNYTHVKLGYQDAYAVHLRESMYENNWSQMGRYNLYMNLSQYDSIQVDFMEKLSKNPVVLDAFMRLPTSKPYAAALYECYRVTKLRRKLSEDLCMSPLECKELRTQKGPQCTVLVSDFKTVDNGLGIILTTTRSSTLVARSRCHIQKA